MHSMPSGLRPFEAMVAHQVALSRTLLKVTFIAKLDSLEYTSILGHDIV